MAVSRSPEALVRTFLGLSQAQLARYLGVAVPVLAHYEAGRQPPSAVVERLLPLMRLLPPPLTSAPPAEPARRTQPRPGDRGLVAGPARWGRCRGSRGGAPPGARLPPAGRSG